MCCACLVVAYCRKLLPHEVRQLQLQLLRSGRELGEGSEAYNSQLAHPLTQSLLLALPNVLRCISSLHALFSPQITEGLSQTQQAMLCPSRRVFVLTYGEDATESPMNKRRNWITNVRLCLPFFDFDLAFADPSSFVSLC